MSEVISGSVLGFIIFCVFIASTFALTLAAVVYAVNKSNQDHYSKREDERDLKIAQLETRGVWFEKRLDELTKELLRRYADDPKDYSVAP